MVYYKRTRVVSQDMRTGEFAYLDQLIKDGYNPGLLVLPKNWEPAVRIGPSSLLPLTPIINLSPPNTLDTHPVILQNLTNLSTGAAVFELFSIGSCGTVTQKIDQNITGTSSIGSCGTITGDVVQTTTASSASTGSAGTGTVQLIAPTVTGVESVGTANASGVMVVITGNSTIAVTGVESVGSCGTVPNGSGWSQGGGWGSNGWGAD